MKLLFLNHYKLIQKRGFIHPDTRLDAFMLKLDEEYIEVTNAYADDCIEHKLPSNELVQEMTDLVMVVMNCFQHFGIDFEDELKKNIRIQEGRVKNIDSK